MTDWMMDVSVQYKWYSYLREDRLKYQTTSLKEVSPHKHKFCVFFFFKLTKESQTSTERNTPKHVCLD